ncbi:MAG TPA: 4'-phosphopantetheinyl transferase superfamily protein [Egibacteraceae bacterium]
MIPELERVRATLPPGIALAAVDPADVDPAALPPEEARLVAGARPSRRREFAAGRWCARQALRMAGMPVDALGADRDGVPRWPHGTTGSIAHKPGLAVALAAPVGVASGLGVDVEPAVGLPDTVAAATLTGAERRRSGVLPPAAAAVRRRLLFAAKEAYAKWYRAAAGGRAPGFLAGEAHVRGTDLRVVPFDPALPVATGCAITGAAWLLVVLW